MNRRTIVGSLQALALVGSLAGAVSSSESTHWQPVELVAMLVGFAVLSETLTVAGRGLRISGSFIAIVLAMVTLGPAPAVLVALSGIVFDATRSRLSRLGLVGNLATYAVFPLVGGLAFARLEPMVDGSDLGRASAVVVFFMAVNVLNFILIAAPNAAVRGHGIADELRSVLVPLLPSQLAAAVLTAAVDALHRHSGLAAVALAGAVALVFQHLLRTTLVSVEHAKELQQRTRELAGMQIGLVTTVLRTLSMRDKMTARHSAAVARYARRVAAELGLDEDAQETIHTAGLLHDIGKFIFPDSILLSSRRLTQEEFEVVKRHPEQGARLVGRLQGYAEVAGIIHAHHERFDGRGYPRGLSAEDIPIGARIIAVCDTYDVMTARDSYKETVKPEAAIAELHRVSGSQLDPAVVAAFVSMVERQGVGFRHNDDADFEAELSFERRVADYARPQVAA